MEFDVVVIGGGPSGMSASLESANLKVKTLLIERDKMLGGILNQCIHNGFGLSYFKEELTGPEYAKKLADKVRENNIEVLLESFVSEIDEKKKTIKVFSPKGILEIKYKALVLATGCRERSAGAINLAGNRPSGVYSAGMVQKMINHYGKIPGEEAVILGSGDIGLVMARRLTLEGVKVKGVFEIMKNSSGLARNIRQCIEDFEIPIMFSHTISRVVGKEKVEGIYYAEVDENLKPIKETEKFLKCDTVLLSVGLIPENNMLENKIEMDNKTKSAIVNEYRQTSIENIFASGNVLHIHDLADNATIEGQIAGRSAGLYVLNELEKQDSIKVEFTSDISYTIPQRVSKKPAEFKIFFRVKNKVEMKKLLVKTEKSLNNLKLCIE